MCVCVCGNDIVLTLNSNLICDDFFFFFLNNYLSLDSLSVFFLIVSFSQVVLPSGLTSNPTQLVDSLSSPLAVSK